MKSYILITFLTLLLVGCVSENEQKGLDQIAALYDAQTSYSKSFNSEMGSKTMKKFNVKISESKRIDTLEPTVTTANIAMLMYESFTQKEKSDYTHIDVELINSKNDTASYYYPVAVLEKISAKSKSFHAFSQSLVDHNFKEVDVIKDHVEIPSSVASGLKTKISTMENKLGKLKSFESFGVAEATDEKGTIFQFQGYLVFDDDVRKPYFTVTDATIGKDKLIGFRIF